MNTRKWANAAMHAASKLKYADNFDSYGPIVELRTKHGKRWVAYLRMLWLQVAMAAIDEGVDVSHTDGVQLPSDELEDACPLYECDLLERCDDGYSRMDARGIVESINGNCFAWVKETETVSDCNLA